MPLDKNPSTEDLNVDWPTTPSGILIMGKRQGSKRENLQLRGRIAMAAALWHSAPSPKPYILFVAADVHGPDQVWDADVVKSLLVNDYSLSADYVIVRRVTNCTLLEVRMARVLKRSYDLDHLFVVTHLYHAPRTQRYLDEVLSNSSVIPVHPIILTEIEFPFWLEDLFNDLKMTINASIPGYIDLAREQMVEAMLNIIHSVDTRGRCEVWLARLLRPQK